MALSIKSVDESIEDNGIKVLLYAPSGAGKTSMLKTAGKVLMISLEKGELALSGSKNIDVLKPTSFAEVHEAFTIAKSKADEYDTIAIDSLSELGDMIVADLKKDPEFSSLKDGYKMWGKYSDIMYAVTRSFREISGVNVVLIALAETVKENFEDKLYPLIPAQKVQKKLPALYDEILYLSCDENGKRSIVTSSTSAITAKDRSGKLLPVEEADFNVIFNKIKGETK